MKKILNLLHPKKTKSFSSLFLLIFSLFLQALIIPILPLPGKIVLDRLQFINNENLLISESSDHFFAQLNQYLSTFSQTQVLFACIAVMVFIGFSLAFFKVIEGLSSTRINLKLISFLRKDLNEKILSRKMAYLDKKKKIDLIGRVSSDIEKITLVFTGAIPTIFRSIPTIAFTVMAMFLTDPLVASVFIIIIPVLYSSTYYFTKKFKTANRSLRNAANTYQEQLHLSYSFFPMSKSLQGEKSLLHQLEVQNDNVLKKLKRLETLRFSFEGFLVFIKSISRALILAVGCYYIYAGRITIGDFFLFFAYLEALIIPIDDIQRFYLKWSKTLVAADRIIELKTEMKDFDENFGSHKPPFTAPRLKFRNVNFEYPDKSHQLLKNCNLSFQKAELVALVGPSGSGKTTFMKLLNRLYIPNSGEILFSDLPLNDWDLQALRKNILLIGQENHLMSGTLADNLRLGTTDKSDQELWSALKKVNGDGFVQELPQKLETVVGEGGQGLSGGQMRRVCLARGFLRTSAAVFIFDEPTSGLDPGSAEIVIQSLKELSQKSLTFFSTHRMHEAQWAHQVLSFETSRDPVLKSPVSFKLSSNFSPNDKIMELQ